MFLKVDVFCDFREELGRLGLLKWGRKRDLIERLTPHRLQSEGSPFDSLPDELVLKIVKMTMCCRQTTIFKRRLFSAPHYDHHFILDTISILSARFNRIAHDRSLWRGRISIDLSKMKKSIEFLNEDTKQFIVGFNKEGNDELTPQMITDISRKCPNLEALKLHQVKVRSWPNLNTPWLLKKLTLVETGIDKNDLFKGKKLHLMLPKLEFLFVYLNTGEEMTVPQISMFKSLSEIRLCGGGTFRTQAGDVIEKP